MSAIPVDSKLQEQVAEARARLHDLKSTQAALNTEIEELAAANGAKVDSLLVPRSERVVYNTQASALLAEERDALAAFFAERDARDMRAAMTGFGADKRALVYIICKRSKLQLEAAAARYAELYSEDLVKRVASEVGGQLGYLLHVILTPSAVYDAELLEEAMKGWGTDESLLTEVLCTRSNAELAAAKRSYLKRTGDELTKDVKADVGGAYEKFLLQCLKATRDENPVADEAEAEAAARKLHAELGAKDGSWAGGDGQLLIATLATPSPAQVECLKAHFEKLSGTTLGEAISAACRGDLRRALLCRVTPKPAFYAERLKAAFAGLGTDERAVARIIGGCTRREVREISGAYEALTGQSLEQALRSELGGLFERRLLEAVLLRCYGDAPGGADDAAPALDGPHEDTALEGTATSALGSVFDSLELAARACVHPSSNAAGVTQLGAKGPFTLRLGSELKPSSKGEISWRR